MQTKFKNKKKKPMPFKSSKQRAKCFALKAQGKAGSWNCSEWAKETKGKKLPTYAKNKKKK